MDARFLVLTKAFKQLKIDHDRMEEYMNLQEQQKKLIFESIDYDRLLKKIENFYSAIEDNDRTIILTHELSDRTSIIKILDYEIFIKDMDGNMLLPLLKRLYRHNIIVEVG